MNYQKHYDCLIERARVRSIEGYVEHHHIIPKCMGGGNEPSNLVALTPEEHYVAHQLLTKIYPDNKKMVYSAWQMTCGKKRSNKIYGWLRVKFKESISGPNNVTYGKTHTAEARIKISETSWTKKPENKERLRNMRLGKSPSKITRDKLRDCQLGKFVSEETREKLRVAALAQHARNRLIKEQF